MMSYADITELNLETIDKMIELNHTLEVIKSNVKCYNLVLEEMADLTVEYSKELYSHLIDEAKPKSGLKDLKCCFCHLTEAE